MTQIPRNHACLAVTLSLCHAAALKGAPGGAAKPRAGGMSEHRNERQNDTHCPVTLIPMLAHPARDSAAPRPTAGLASV
jgi:hypothetical protein